MGEDQLIPFGRWLPQRDYRLLILGIVLLVASPALACEPVLPFVQVMVPAIALSRSLLVLVVAVLVKSILFAVFEPRLPHLHAAWRMLVGNVLTSAVGLIAAVMIASSARIWFVGVPLVGFLGWLPSRRLVEVAPLVWLSRMYPSTIAAIMTSALVVSCILFMAGQGAIETHQLALYWIIKLAAILSALLASVTLTTVWEEWAIWRLSSRPDGRGFFPSVLRTNLYVLILVMAVPAAFILPERMKSPDFLAKRSPVVTQNLKSLR